MAPLTTTLTSLLDVRHPIMLAGMDQVAGPKLAAAVTAAGGFGTVGGARYTPKMLREMLAELKQELKDRGCEQAPFGVDLLLPQVGGSARKTNVSMDLLRNCSLLSSVICFCCSGLSMVRLVLI